MHQRPRSLICRLIGSRSDGRPAADGERHRDANGRQHYARTFDGTPSEGQRSYYEQEEARVTRFVRWGIETCNGDATWQIVVLAMLLPWSVFSLIALCRSF